MADRRLFFGLWPERKVRDRLVRVGRQFGEAGGRQHHPDDLHMTLVFLGKVTEQQLPCVKSVADAVDVERFSLVLNRMGYWPRPRILWCGPEKAPDVLNDLVAELKQGLQSCGFEAEQRTYKPHVTLLRKMRGGESGLLEPSIEWEAREFVLASSGNGPDTPSRYRIIGRWSMGAINSTEFG
ncbi:MAG: RNA 2',3'-cyclic phosphodiesterase [gamma proteobacterium endosymbiont of Lamellibrachia anaximandri]|nr:RNA 2',3'-cyclic phosphodiesterase [gamma proteobacterium endosymbiont of Lamellibrachia anaximandri]